ncbi:MAG: histidine kinase [Methylothermaceae bacteria B42]|nr:MAG: histidine kinase [Methylothermaceae bacteria B42]HHJ39488.1 HDOD domain-containing protein [Methylothermaceae bacterium]
MQFNSDQEFLAFLLDEIENDRITLPSLPEVALEVKEALDKGNVTASKLADIIAKDTALSAKLLQVANSPMYRARAEITNIQMAVMRMGYDTVRTLMLSLAMKQVFQPTSPLLSQYLQEIWQTSVNVSAISRALSALAPNLDSEQAMLAGLIHQIGKLPILTLAEQMPELANDKATLGPLLESLHPQIGGVIMKHWRFPEALYKVATEYCQWQRQTDNSEADYVDLVQVAYFENLTSNGQEPPVDPAQVTAFGRLGLEPEIESIEMEGIEETKALFN